MALFNDQLQIHPVSLGLYLFVRNIVIVFHLLIDRSRIHGIVRELKNENIDVINFTENTPLLIQRALSPAKVTSIKIDEESDRAEVYMKTDQVSLAIGKGGYNIKLACQLTGYEIDVYRDSDTDVEDVDLSEFVDEIDEWIIKELQKIGCDTAKSVLELEEKDLVARTDRSIWD